ncbi:MAG: hypothetical protein ACYTG6_09035, partial [Planctomycetota bacterium]
RHCEEIDARELPAGLRSEENFLAFRAYDPAWQATVGVTRHDYEEVAEVVVSHMHLDTVVTQEEGEDGTVRATTEAYLVVRNNDRQYLELRLPAGANIRALSVEGRSQTPRKGDADDKVLVPLLSGLGKDEAFVVALAFAHEVETTGALFETTHITSPIPLQVTADLLTWRVYMPEGRAYTSLGGSVEPSEPYRSWVAGAVDGLSRIIGRRSPGGTVDVQRLADGFQSPFAMQREGHVFFFSNRIGTGDVEITSTHPVGFAFWKILFFALAFGATRFLCRLVSRLPFRVGAGTVVAALVLLLLVLLVPASPGTAQVLNAMLYGVALAGLFQFVGWGLARRREGAALRAEAAADDAGPEASSDDGGDAPPATPAPEGGAA